MSAQNMYPSQSVSIYSKKGLTFQKEPFTIINNNGTIHIPHRKSQIHEIIRKHENKIRAKKRPNSAAPSSSRSHQSRNNFQINSKHSRTSG